MFNIVYAVIASKDFELSDITNKINTLWIQSKITDEEKDELTKFAKENANPENSYAPLERQAEELYKKIDELSARVEKLEWSDGSGTETPKEDEYPEYVQPTGAHDAYNTGDKVTYKKNKYICKINSCVWDPDTYPEGWELVV